MSNTAAIRNLNDRFRQTLQGGRVFITPGIAKRADAAAIVNRVRIFTEFSGDNDPHGEHDFGAFDVGVDKIFWKIDYYDADMAAGSPDPSDIAVTTRVLTVMLAEEY